MRHIKDAQNSIKAGNSQEALETLEGVLSLAPHNPEALRLKARLLDARGYFDASWHVLQRLSRLRDVPEEVMDDLEERALEERETLVYTEMTPQGRMYWSLSQSQIWVSFMGFLGCASFLWISADLGASEEHLPILLGAFALLVILPWILLMVINFVGVKRVFVGRDGLTVFRRLRQEEFLWEDYKTAVIEYANDSTLDHLRLYLYPCQKDKKEPLVFDISRGKSTVKARRHFVRTVLLHMENHIWLEKERHIPSSLDSLIERSQTTSDPPLGPSAPRPASNGNTEAA